MILLNINCYENYNEKLKQWIKYGSANALIGFLIGFYIAIRTDEEGFIILAIAAPLAAFLIGGILWKYSVKAEFNTAKIVICGLLTGTISHYVTWVFLSIGINICYWTTGNCIGILGDPPLSIVSMFGGAFAFSYFSLRFFGWITIPVSIIIGLILKFLEIRN